MAHSILGSITLGYELVWNQKRRCAGVRLFVAPAGTTTVDARHLLDTLASLWPVTAPTLLLHVQSAPLLTGLLDHPVARGVWLEVQDTWLSDPTFAAHVRQAHQRGWPLVWSGAAGHAPPPHCEAWFHKTLRTLTPHEALDALRVSLRQRQDGGLGAPRTAPSPVLAGSLYHGLASQALVEHALDRQHAWGVAGWPAEEILHAYRFRQILPSHRHIRELLKALEADASLESLEHRLGEEPLLTYRFLRYANSAHLGARTEVTSVRQGLMVMGYSQLRTWLADQLPTANEDVNLDPIRAAMVLRADLMAHLCQAGIEDELRREVFLCGIFSQLDLLLGESLGAAIHRLPLPGRIASAVVGQTGPYAPWLAVAAALESANTRVVRDVCEAHGMSAEAVNRALLRALAGL